MQHIATQSRGWQPEHTLSVAEAIKEAMDDSPVRTRSRRSARSRVESPRDLPAPEPHLPLRRASANSRFQARNGSVPKPILAPPTNNHHRVRGFNPSPVQPPVPHLESITASSEHAFAGREPRRPYKSAVGTLENQTVLQYAEASPVFNGRDGRPPSSPLLPPPPRSSDSSATFQRGKSLKSSKSVGDGIASLRHRVSGRQPGPSGRMTPDGLNTRPNASTGSEEIRDSFRSALTSHSSLGHTSSINTTYTSVSGRSSHSESFVKVQRTDYEETGLTDVDMSVEDAIGMYEDGFESGAGSARGSFDVRSIRSMDPSGKLTPDVRSVRSFNMDRPASQPHPHLTIPQHPSTPLKPQRPHAAHRRSQSASVLILGIPKHARPGAIAESRPSLQVPLAAAEQIRSSVQIATNQQPDGTVAVPRDRYGFKKASQYITVEQYDSWNSTYSNHLERRSRKWHVLMQSYGLSTDQPLRFPPKSDKIKRYVRKGIPPEFRGAAWFWYAGGPGKLAKEPGLYWELLEKVENGLLSETDREHIERDLNRTFPDNVKFKPDPPSVADAQANAGGGNKENIDPSASPDINKKKSRRQTQEIETPILKALRRVLQAFAVHSPNIGYCQSLNFIAGLLLIFLDEDEEKTFILLNIVTSQHLPGTHGINLEGANIDIAVLMSCIKDTLPGVWTKLDDKGGGAGGPLRLPTVSLATTAWFMSLFVGTLPIESVLRVWDCLFFEGSKTLFRIALAIFKFGEQQILKVSDPMEIFQVVQVIPRGTLDVNALMEVCYRRRGGFGSVSQGLIEGRRAEMRRRVKEGISATGEMDEGTLRRLRGRLRRGTAKA